MAGVLTSELPRVPDPCFEPSEKPPTMQEEPNTRADKRGVKRRRCKERDTLESDAKAREQEEKGQLERQGCAKAEDQEAQREERGSLSLLLKTDESKSRA
jgi:hypothetical protein